MENFNQLPDEAHMMVIRYTPHPVSLLLEEALEHFSRKHPAYVCAHSEALGRKRDRMFEDCVTHRNSMVRRRRRIVEARGDPSLFDAKDLRQWAWYESDDWDDDSDWLSTFQRARSRSPRSSGNRFARGV